MEFRRSIQSIRVARFSLVGFPDFIVDNSPHDLAKAKETWESVKHLFPEGWTVRPPSRETEVVFQTGDGWEIKLTKQPNKLRGMVNHEGVVRRMDGSEYQEDDLEGLLEGIGNFFAFVTGDYCHPTVIIGYSSDHNPVWGRVGRFADNSRTPVNWFNNDCEQLTGYYLEDLFSRFWDKRSEKSKEIDEAIGLFLRSSNTLQNGNPIGALAESYAALETLASLTSGKTIKGDKGD